MQPTPEFVPIIQAVVPKATPLVVGCAAGGRSARACEMLEQAGYATRSNIDGGIRGRHDRMGCVAQEAWLDLGLPVSCESPEGVSFESLKTRAR